MMFTLSQSDFEKVLQVRVLERANCVVLITMACQVHPTMENTIIQVTGGSGAVRHTHDHQVLTTASLRLDSTFLCKYTTALCVYLV